MRGVRSGLGRSIHSAPERLGSSFGLRGGRQGPRYPPLRAPRLPESVVRLRPSHGGLAQGFRVHGSVCRVSCMRRTEMDARGGRCRLAFDAGMASCRYSLLAIGALPVLPRRLRGNAAGALALRFGRGRGSDWPIDGNRRPAGPGWPPERPLGQGGRGAMGCAKRAGPAGAIGPAD